jgi:pimeloyl-ACP methyl ester carboxylesterase
MSLLKNLFGGSYEDLWKAVIRPNRDEYKEEDLGPEKFKINHKYYKRTDFSITNKRGLKLMCSFWEPFDEERDYVRLPCVVYLHGNSSSRCEAVAEVKYLLPLNITVFAFDFSGCGKSQGEYISLGYYEREDVESVIEYLRKTNKVSTIGLWGRSMGAVTAIMYGDRDPSIAGMVLDSAFASLKELIEELVKDRVKLPDFILNQATKLVKSTINKKAKFNLDEIEPKKYAVRCFIPALFCHANGDTFVNVHHCKDLYDIYAGDKNVIYVDGNHNSPRPRYFRDSAAIFFYNTLQCERMKEISDDYNGFKHVVNENEDIKENENKEEEEKIINNNNNDFNFPEFNNFNNENEEYMLQQILELSLKEYEGQNKQNNDNNININNNNNINNLINNISSQPNNNIINNENNIINENEINNNINLGNNEININLNKGLFNDLNPVPLQNHEKIDPNLDFKGP